MECVWATVVTTVLSVAYWFLYGRGVVDVKAAVWFAIPAFIVLFMLPGMTEAKLTGALAADPRDPQIELLPLRVLALLSVHCDATPILGCIAGGMGGHWLGKRSLSP